MVLLLVIAMLYFMFFQNAGALLSLNKAVNNLYAEMIERVDKTPLKAVKMLPGILEDGTITADFSYSNNIINSWIPSDVSGNIIFASNTKSRDYALKTQLDVFDRSHDLDIYMNKERAAFRLQLLGNLFYGINYDTFRDDIRVFGRLLRLNDQRMDSYADVVDRINDMMNAEEPDEDVLNEYIGVFTDFVRNLDISSSRVGRYNDDKYIKRCIEIKISKDDLLTLFNDLYNIYENDHILQERLNNYNNYMLAYLLNGDYDDREFFADDFKEYIKRFEKDFAGDIKVTFFLGNEDRLVRFVINAGIDTDENYPKYGVTFYFGGSITDEWVFSFWMNEENNNETIYFKWFYEEQSDTYINTMLVTTMDMSYIDLASSWNEETGKYILSYDDGSKDSELTGYFTPDNSGFRFSVDNIFPDDSSNKVTFDLFAKPGSQIDKIEFVNIDKWGRTMLTSVIRLLFETVF